MRDEKRKPCTEVIIPSTINHMELRKIQSFAKEIMVDTPCNDAAEAWLGAVLIWLESNGYELSKGENK